MHECDIETSCLLNILLVGHAWPNDIETSCLLNILLVGHAWPNDIETSCLLNISRSCMA